MCTYVYGDYGQGVEYNGVFLMLAQNQIDGLNGLAVEPTKALPLSVRIIISLQMPFNASRNPLIIHFSVNNHSIGIHTSLQRYASK